MDTKLLEESLQHIGYTIFATIDINDNEIHLLTINDNESHTIIMKSYKQYYRVYTTNTARKGFIQLQHNKFVDPIDLSNKLINMIESDNSDDYKKFIESITESDDSIKHIIEYVSNDSVLYSIERNNATIGSVYYYRDDDDLAGIVKINDCDDSVDIALQKHYELITL